MKFKADKDSIKKLDLETVSNDALKAISDDLLKGVRGGNFTRSFTRTVSG